MIGALFLSVIIVGLGAWASARSNLRWVTRRSEAWKLVGERFGLTYGPEPEYLTLRTQATRPRVRGTCQGFTVEVLGAHERLRIKGLEKSLRLSAREARGVLEVLGAPVLAPEVMVGDPRFEQAVAIRSHLDLQTFAVLDGSTRAAIKRAVLYGVEVVNGELNYRMRGLESVEELFQHLEMALDLAQRLTVSTTEIPGKLLSLARDDRAPRVRTRALASLIAWYPEARETAQAGESVGPEQVEPMLLEHLQEGSRGQDAVFAALGEIGTLPAIDRLLQLDCDRSAERARAAAIAKIQKRLGLGEGGQLSLAQDAPESGSLSTAAHDSGQLRIADREGEER